MGGGRWVAAGLALLLMPQAALAWTQLGGGPAREGVALLPDGPLDVLSDYRFFQNGEFLWNWREQGLVETPHGLFGAGVAFSTGTFGGCFVFRIHDTFAGATERGADVPCWTDRGVVGYDASRDLVLLCAMEDANSPVLRAFEAATGKHRWSIRPQRDFGVVHLGDYVTANGYDIWYCSGAAIDEKAGVAVVPFYSRTVGPPLRNRVAMIELDTGQVRWVVNVPPSVFFQARTAAGQEEFYYRPYVATLTGSGIALSGILGLQFAGASQRVTPVPLPPPVDGHVYSPPVRQDAFEWAVAWLDMQGEVKGGQIAEQDAATIAGRLTGTPAITGGSLHPAAQGGQAVMALGPRILLIDPTQATVFKQVSHDTEEDLRGSDWWPAARWWGETILVPLPHSVSAFGSKELDERWLWPAEEWRVADTLIVPPGDAYVLASRSLVAGHEEAKLVRLDLASGDVVQEIPLPMRPRYSGTTVGSVSDAAAGGTPVDGRRWDGRLQPLLLEDRLLVWDMWGQAVVLGKASGRLVPRADLSDAYPRLGEPVVLSLDAASAVKGYLVSWGEGPVEVVDPQVAETNHRYTTPGARTIRVTAVYDDNRTATRELQVHPDGDAPDTGILADYLGPGREDRTWGVIGVLVALVGAVAGYLLTKYRRRLLGKEMGVLERIKAHGARDPAGAIRSLEAFREQLQRDFAHGKVPEAQFSALDLRSGRLMRSLQEKLMAGFGDRVSARFQHLLSAALEDGIMNKAEGRALLEGLHQEKGLSKAERGSLSRLIQSLA